MEDLLLTSGIRPNWSIPLVGRTEELSLIEPLTEKVIEGKGQILLVTGDAGMGKSRLVLEARQRSWGLLGQWSARCQPHTQPISYYPFQEWLREFFKIPSDAAFSIAAELLIQQISSQQWLAHLHDYRDHLLSLMGYPLPPEGRVSADQWKKRSHQAVAELWKAMASQGPTCLIFEDMHSVDPSSEELLEQLIPLVSEIPLLLCLVYRGGRRKRWEEPKDHLTYLKLEPLPTEEAEELARQLLQSDCLPQSFREAVLKGQDFTPLYIEEVVRKLITEEILVRGDSGWLMIGSLGEDLIPDDLMAVIQSRMTKLGNGTRQVLEAGAVIGRDFALNLLDFLDITREGMRDKLATLEGMGFVHRDLDRRGLEFTFRHTLIRDAVYESLQEQQKQDLHRQVVKSLLSLYGEDSEPHYAHLAYHATQAGMFETALKYLERCAERAQRLYAGQEAVEYYTQILGLLTLFARSETASDKILEILLKQAYVHLNLGDTGEASRDIEQAQQVLELTHSPKLSTTFYLRRAQLLYRTGDCLQAKSDLDVCCEILQKFEDPVLEMYVNNIQGIIAWRNGEFDEAERFYQQVIALAEQTEKPLYATNAYNNLGLISGSRGDEKSALHYHKQALTYREQTGDEMGLAASHNNIGIIYENSGNYRSAENHYLQALQLAEKTGFQEVETAVLANLGQLAELRERYSEAVDFASRSLRCAQRAKDPRSEAIVLDNLGNGYQALGRLKKARYYYEAALELSAKIADRDVMSRAQLGLSQILVQLGSLDHAETHWTKAKDLIEEMNLNDSRARMARTRAELLGAQGNQAEALRELILAQEFAAKYRQPREEDLAKKRIHEIQQKQNRK